MIRILRTAALAVIALGASIVSADVRIQGAGATFPNPLYQRWIGEYQQAHPEVKIDYQSIGSGGGIKDITDKTVHFAGSDAPMSKKEIEAVGGPDKIVEIPSCAGGVVPAYRVPGINEDLKFTGEVLAEIYMGQINKWNDPKLTQLNPGVNLPNLPITPAWRTDGSGTTFIWTNYLVTQNKTFASSIGAGKQVRWPRGQGGKGNEGVAQIVEQTAGAIGYLEQNYADKNHIAYGLVQNKNGKFVKASPKSVSMAGEGAVGQMNGQILASNIWNQPGDEAYPISSFTYLIVYKDLSNVQSKEQAQALHDFLTWATHDGQKFAIDLDYAPLSEGVRKRVEAALETVRFHGQSVATAR